jgi:hypothetical protein
MLLTEELRDLEQEFRSVTRDSGRKPSGERWRRTKLDFCGGEPFNDHHWSTTLGTASEMVRARSVLKGLRFLGCTEELKTKWQESGTPPVGQETEVANAHEAFREQV